MSETIQVIEKIQTQDLDQYKATSLQDPVEEAANQAIEPRARHQKDRRVNYLRK